MLIRLVRLLLPGLACACGCGPVWAGDLVFGPPQRVAEVRDARVKEASGLIASRRHPGLFYTHNDSPTPHELYLLDRSGGVRAVVRLAGVANYDWEDIAWAPRPGRPGEFDVILGDIGDNSRRRREIVLYRFAEPELPPGAGGAVEVQPQIVKVKYPDEPHNVESLFVDPASGDAYLLTKSVDEVARIYRLEAPWADKAEATLAYAGQVAPSAFAVRLFTAADISGDGRVIAVRTLLGACIWERAADEPIAATLHRTPFIVPLAAEEQGEGLALAPDGRSIMTISEGSPTALNEVVAEP